MDRRAFVAMGMAAGSGLASAATDKRTRYYAMHSFKLKNGSQVPGLHDSFSKRAPQGSKIFLEAVVAPHLPQIVVIEGLASLGEPWALHPDSGAEPLFESLDTSILEATEYSPELTPTAQGKPARWFELRTYHAPTFHQLKFLHERFTGPEIKIFHRVGIHPVLYTNTIAGTNLPNLTYLIPFDDLAARDKAWTAFNADPEWQKARKESIDRGGQIAEVLNVSLFKATAYSPVR